MKSGPLARLLLLFTALAMTSLAQAAPLQEEPAEGVEITWIDVRTAEEFDKSHVDGAVNIPHEQIEAGVAGLGLDDDAVIYLYCGSGRRADIAQKSLVASGYSGVVNMGGLEEALAAAEGLRLNAESSE